MVRTQSTRPHNWSGQDANPIFSYGSTLCKLEGFSLLKVLGLALSMAGTLMVGLSDDKGGGGGQNTVGGDILCLLAAIM